MKLPLADDEYIGNFRTDAAGNYMTPGLPTGSYMVEFIPSTFRPSRVYVGEYYNDQMIRDTADPIAVTAGTDVPAINAQLARGTQISGRVTDANTAEPLRDVDVIVYDYCSLERITTTKTDLGGSYTTPGLPSGSYGVRFEPRSLGGSSAYISATYADQSSAPAEGRIDTTAPTDVNDIDAQLRRGGAITGIVIAADTGDPLDNVSVRASSADTGTVATGETDNAGAYTIEGLPSGEYTVYFNTVNSLDIAENYVSTFYNNQATRETADTVSVTAPNTTDTIDAVLTRGSAINGTVTAADTGIPLDDVVVNIRDTDGNFLGVEPVAPDGNYRVFGLPSGSYKVEFDTVMSSRWFTVFPVNDAFAYLDEYYRGQSTVGTADLVTITATNDLNNIDADLERGGQISGRVTAADTGDPLKNVEVFIEGVAEPVTTDEDGRYITPGLPSGDYWIWFFTRSNDINYIGELYADATVLNDADPVSVTAPTITRNIDGSLAPAGSITGVVTDAGTGEPLVSISVEAECERPDGAVVVLDGETNARGEYVLTGLPTSTCTVRFVDWFNFCVELAPEYYNDQPFVDMATPVDVTAPNTTSNIDAALNVGGSISGIVTGEDSGLGLDRVAVRAYTPSGDEVSSSTTANDGSYTISNLPPGSYVIEFAPIVGPSYAYIRKFYNNKPSQTAADTVTVTANAETGGINAVLARGGQISGTITGGVTDAGVNAVLARGGQISGTITGEVIDEWVNVEVIVYDRVGNILARVHSEPGTGNYITPGLPSGDYVIQFVPENVGRGYMSEFYNNKRTRAAADPVTVTARSVTARIDAAIDVGFTVYLPFTTR
ncbi:MAG: carboxypeptidase regulatory-like domain-containing protein [Chloroflexaceae bacterium]